MAKLPLPQPLIPSPSWLVKSHTIGKDYRPFLPCHKELSAELMQHDLSICINHILEFEGSIETMESYRSECNRFLNWAWLIAGKSLMSIKRHDVVEYLDFCLFPPSDWIAPDTPPQFFYGEDGTIEPNLKWRPFAANARAQSSVDVIFSRLSSLFQCEALLVGIGHNPVRAIRQKSKHRRRVQGKRTPRIITKVQVAYCINVLEDCCHSAESMRDILIAERALFAFSTCLGLYLRISEFVNHERHNPCHGHFFRDSDRHWWLKVVGKGNVERPIAVSDDVLDALKRWRDVLGLTPLPAVGDTTPMFPSMSNACWDAQNDTLSKLVSVSDTLIVWKTFRMTFKMAYQRMLKEGKEDDALELLTASAHWLRHTGITEDVEHRPIEHVRDDAGHSSIETTWHYVNATNRERAKSKKAASRSS